MKQLVYLALICLLLGGVYFIKVSIDKKPALVADMFLIDDTDVITKIEIISDDFENMTFVKTSDQWYLQRDHKARSNAMDNMLEVFEGLRIKYIPQEAAKQNINRDMKKIGIDVIAYDKNGEVLKHYLIGSSTADERGTYMKLAGDEQAYVTHLPTLEGSVRGRFIMRYDEWRDRTVFKDDPAFIKSVEVEYPRQQLESFRIEDGEVVSLATSQKVIRPDKAAHYLSGYNSIVAEAFENSNPNQDSIRQLLPFCQIRLELENGDKRSLKLYPVENYVQESLVNLSDAPRINRYFGDTNHGDMVLLQQRIIGKLLRGFSYFAAE